MDGEQQNNTIQNTESTTGIRGPSLTINYSASVFSDKKFTEYVNTEMLERLIQSSNILRQDKWGDWDLYENELAQLKAYKKLIKYSKAEVTYKKLEHDYGRVFPVKSLSLGTLAREIRHTICKDYYADIDIVNCHCIVLEQICKAHTIQCKNLSLYNQQRDTILHDICNKYFVSRDDAKTLFIIHLYLGSFKSWADKLEIVDEKPTDFLMDFANELKAISVDIEKANPQLKKDVEKANKKESKAKKPKFWRSTILSLFLQDWERRILEEVYNYLCHHKYIIDNDCVLCFDGIMIHNSRYTEELLPALSKHIKERMGFDIQFSRKEMSNDIIKALEYNEINIVDKQEEKQMEVYRKHRAEFEKKCAKILNPLCYMCKDNKDGFVSEKVLKEMYRDHPFTYGSSHKKFISMWLDDSEKLKYNSVEFIPDLSFNEPDILNSFKGFDIVKYTSDIVEADSLIETQKLREEKCSVLLNFIKNLCNGCEKDYEFLKNWIAWLVQKPNIKTGVCVVMNSVLNHGVGKNTFYTLLSLIIGETYTNCTADIHTVFNGDGYRFANGRKDKLLICLNEVEFGETAKLSSKLKDAITEDTFDMEIKGVNPMKCNNYNNFMIFSNKDIPIIKEKADRRYYDIHIEKCPYDTDSEKEIYFKNIYKILKNPETNKPDYSMLRTLFDYFNNINLDNVFLQTYVLEKNKRDEETNTGIVSREPIDEFFQYWISYYRDVDDKDYKFDTNKYSNIELYNEFKKYLNVMNCKYDISLLQFGKFTQKFTAGKSELNTKGVFLVKSLTKGRTCISISIPHIRAYYKC